MPAKANHRIIIDTNLWISFLLTRDFSEIEAIMVKNRATLIFSNELLEEFITVARRSKFQKYFSLSDLENLLKKIHLVSELVFVNSEIKICRDPKDNFLLALALDGKATHLLTGDKDLLVLDKFEETSITSIKKYLSGK